MSPRLTVVLLLGSLQVYGASDAEIKSAAAKGVALIQSSASGWYAKQSCESCHHQLLPLMAYRAAREHGIPLDEAAAANSANRTFPFFESIDSGVQGSRLVDPSFSGAMLLVAAADAGVPPNTAVAALARLLAARQQADGHWDTFDQRPPQSYSPVSATAFAIRALSLYSSPRLKSGVDAGIARARSWLSAAKPRDTEEYAMRLLGLSWAAASAAEIRAAGDPLIGMQRDDGGWSELPGYSGDAYSTGEALVALATSGLARPSSAVYRRGIDFLLRTEQPDGSWHVPTRISPLTTLSPPYFETGYPYGHDQFISCMGAVWAVTALAEALPRTDRTPPSLSLKFPASESWINTALFGTAEELRLALDAGLNANRATPSGVSLLMMAGPDAAKVKLLLERGADVNVRAKNGYTALTTVANYYNGLEAARLLLGAGADVNAGKTSGSAVLYAVSTGNRELVRLLLDRGAKVRQTFVLGGVVQISPAGMTAAYGYPELLVDLLRAGADPDEKDTFGVTLLSYAALKNDPKLVDILIGAGAKLNEPDGMGMTPLLWASHLDWGDSTIVRLLLARGADPNIKSKEGKTALALARQFSHGPAAQALASAR